MISNISTVEALAKNASAKREGRKPKFYSYSKIVEFISKYKNDADIVVVGIEEDWNWTAERVWDCQNGLRLKDEDVVEIAGIGGSSWGTPTAIAMSNGKVFAKESVWVEG